MRSRRDADARRAAGRAVRRARGVRDFRKHVGWYLTGYPVGGDRRKRLTLADSLAALGTGLDDLDRSIELPADAVRIRRGHTNGPRLCAPARRLVRQRRRPDAPAERGRGPGLGRVTSAACRLVLASGSPRRHQLLRSVGVEFTAMAPDIDETPTEGEEPTVTYVERLAREKAAAVQAGIGDVVLVADTTVALGPQIFGKPIDADDARRMLRALSARAPRRPHRSGRPRRRPRLVRCARTRVTMVRAHRGRHRLVRGHG